MTWSTRDREVRFTVPVKTKNPLNQRQHWRVVSRRAAEEKELTILSAPRVPKLTLPCVVVMSRFSTKDLDDHDGLRAALKHVADGVAEWVGVDDKERTKIQFQYGQWRCKRGEECVRVVVIQSARIVETIHFVEAEVE